MILTDYHMHTGYSPDAAFPMAEMAARAAELGLTEIAFTDHHDYIPEGYKQDPHIDFNAYMTELARVRKQYEDRLRIVFGVEIGLVHTKSDEIDAFLMKYPFDFIIGSSHDTPTMPLYRPVFFEGKDKKTAYYEYFNELLQNINAVNGFSVYGHLDYIPRYGVYGDNTLRHEDYAEVIDEILKALISRGKGIEVNTSGFRYGLGCTHPQLSILRRYRECGGEIVTVGSDAHSPEHIAANFKEAAELLKQAGFKAHCLFRARKPVWVDLD